jgi:Flp pilus assembly protein TadD
LTFYLAEAELLLNHGQPQQAWAVYIEGLEKYPADRRLRYGRAMAAEKLGRLQDAEADLRTVIKLHPNDADSLNALGYLLTVNTERYQEARALIEQALTLQPENPAILDSMGWVDYKLGLHDQAEAYLRRAYRLQDDPEVAAHLGELLWTTNRRDEARRIWTQARKAHPDNEVLRDTMRRFGLP